VDDGEMQGIDCPTENMWADVLTKPLQGMAFKRMQAELMNCSVEYEEDEERETPLHTKLLSERGKVPSQTLQKCVGDNTKSHKAADRQVGVSRLVRHSEPPVQKRGRE
jgi:hypothetical protein